MDKYLIIATIPARYASSRLHGKLLKDIQGKTVIQRVYEQCKKAKLLNRIVVVTDHELILEHLKSLGAEVFMSTSEHHSGTDRIAEFIESEPNCTHVVNVQGDEPFVNPGSIDSLIENMLSGSSDIFTLANTSRDINDYNDSNKVKLVSNLKGEALYFSRAGIPFVRDRTNTGGFRCKKHVGIYGYSRNTLLKLTKLPVSELEELEKLEQLRWLESGYKIHVGLTEYNSIGIDTEEDLIQASEFARINQL